MEVRKKLIKKMEEELVKLREMGAPEKIIKANEEKIKELKERGNKNE